jgi:class 3 adenylate cyclase
VSFSLPTSGRVEAFAMIVDINGFTGMVSRSGGEQISQFVRDVLYGSIRAIEESGGHVVAFMGDAILGVLPDSESASGACFLVAKDLNAQCEYISTNQEGSSDCWNFADGGASLKIGIEHGWLDVSQISSQVLGTQRLIIGDAINHAARILSAGSGNRCLIGPSAVQHGFSDFSPDGPYYVDGKPGESKYEYFQLYLGDIWIEGQSGDGLTYW